MPHRDKFLNGALYVRVIHAFHQREELEVFEHGQRGEDHVVLRAHAQAAPARRVLGDDRTGG
jgi:hypothetical protein